MRTIEELQKLLEINKNDLDEELVRQPQLFYEASEQYALAASKRDTAKHITDKLAAELSNQFRSASLEKVTESKLEKQVEADSSYIEQYKWYLKYKAEADQWNALKDAFAQRSWMLRDLVSLFSAGYWGSGIRQEDVAEQEYIRRMRNQMKK